VIKQLCSEPEVGILR
jgi:ectoine hydroxylase-related dioxygenase (phytanoyl-CoA dioxygenase family)